MSEKRTEAEIQELLRRYRSRGSETRQAFCEREGIAKSSLDYYLRRRARPSVRLARVKVTSQGSSIEGRFSLVLTNGRRIDCGPAELEQLISAAERA